MKALSLWQPWASLLVHGRKQCETRDWPISHRGPLLIHAAKKWDGDLRRLCNGEPFRTALEAMGLGAAPDCGLPFGAIIGRVDVVATFPTATAVLGLTIGEDENHKGRLRITKTENAFGDYTAGRFVFLCANPLVFTAPIPYRGQQGLFEVPDNLLPKEVA